MTQRLTRRQHLSTGLDASFRQTLEALGREDPGGTLYLTGGRVIKRKPNQSVEDAIADSEKDAS
jgi:hypothetical protein